MVHQKLETATAIQSVHCGLMVKRFLQLVAGGYDMKGTALGHWIAKEFQKDLNTFKKSFYGLKFYNPNWKPSKECIEEEKKDELTKLTGLARYQDFYKQSSDLPTEKHTRATLDGACGFDCMTAILNHMGYNLKYIDGDRNTTTYTLQSTENLKVA